MLKIEIPADTYCESCDEAEATTYHDHDGWIPPTFYCQDCKDRIESAYEGPTDSENYGGGVVMNEYGRVF
jgi:hypothetical protein